MVVVVTPMSLSKEIQLQQLAIVTKPQTVKLSMFNGTWDKLVNQINVVNQTFMMLNL